MSALEQLPAWLAHMRIESVTDALITGRTGEPMLTIRVHPDTLAVAYYAGPRYLGWAQFSTPEAVPYWPQIGKGLGELADRNYHIYTQVQEAFTKHGCTIPIKFTGVEP